MGYGVNKLGISDVGLSGMPYFLLFCGLDVEGWNRMIFNIITGLH